MNIAKSVLAQNIDRRMADLGVRTYKELAAISEVSASVLTNISSNPKKSVMAPVAVMLAKALKCRVEWLVTGEGPMNLDEVERANRLRFGAPVIEINELARTDPKDLLLSISEDETRERHPCPKGNAESLFIIKTDVQIGKYPAGGMIYFDWDSEPSSGQLVVARTAEGMAPEVMEYYFARGKKFLKCLSEEIPKELLVTEIEPEMEIIAVMKSYAI
ncbi:helix-turn-helix domain-containing protein [Vibrio sp. ER1A]|uniref:helix-turn-helix domain-containing protein n=1 Tax=Vibrio sp. ER1A TaxID=1517681 RepID=UPI0004DD478A|nr:helix-turn-helix transcriptional regulator [Vibrio sp. ER1A]KFA99446.1 hypothetical protein HW45_03530 [Vibrio sp. ER1A]